MGDALLQKTYTPAFLAHKSITNNRIVQQYYVENSHEAIIDPKTWQIVQTKLKEQKISKSSTVL